MKTIILKTIFILSLFSLFAFAGETIKQETFKVYGNCGMCESRIKKALKISEVKFARWDKETKLLTVAYNVKAITSDSLQKIVASVGHDTEKYKATDEAYNNLPGCCLYRAGKSH
jgi:mercuric ion binding protein